MDVSPVCWKCGASLGNMPVPIGRRDECPSCSADLHVCRMCEFYDPSVSQSCREPVADEVYDKEKANFCGYFKVNPDAYQRGAGSEAEAAKSKLAALFGEEHTEKSDGGAADDPQSEAKAAKAKLEQLFGIDGKKDG